MFATRPVLKLSLFLLVHDSSLEPGEEEHLHYLHDGTLAHGIVVLVDEVFLVLLVESLVCNHNEFPKTLVERIAGNLRFRIQPSRSNGVQERLLYELVTLVGHGVRIQGRRSVV